MLVAANSIRGYGLVPKNRNCTNGEPQHEPRSRVNRRLIIGSLSVFISERTAKQLHLFRGKRQRGDVLKSEPSEFQLHVTVADMLLRWSLPGVE